MMVRQDSFFPGEVNRVGGKGWIVERSMTRISNEYETYQQARTRTCSSGGKNSINSLSKELGRDNQQC